MTCKELEFESDSDVVMTVTLNCMAFILRIHHILVLTTGWVITSYFMLKLV